MSNSSTRKKRLVYTGLLTVSLLLNSALIPLSISGQFGQFVSNNETSSNETSFTNYSSLFNHSITFICESNPVNVTCTRNQTQIKSDLGGNVWVHKCDNGLYDIRQFLNGKTTVKGINLNTKQWLRLQKLGIL